MTIIEAEVRGRVERARELIAQQDAEVRRGDVPRDRVEWFRSSLAAELTDFADKVEQWLR